MNSDYIAHLDGYSVIEGGWLNHHWVQLGYVAVLFFPTKKKDGRNPPEPWLMIFIVIRLQTLLQVLRMRSVERVSFYSL